MLPGPAGGLHAVQSGGLPILRCMSTLEKRIPWIIVALAVFAGLGGYLASQKLFAPGASPPQLAGTLLYPQPKPLPAFTLQRSDGSALTDADWHGRWRLVFFGFANCPDVCPTTLATTKAALAALRQQRPDADIAVSFVSVDPERDELAKLGEYVRFFDPAFEAATGTQEQLGALTRALGVLYMKVPNGPGPLDYTIDHSASLLVINPQGELHAIIRPPHQADVIAKDLAALLSSSKD